MKVLWAAHEFMHFFSQSHFDEESFALEYKKSWHKLSLKKENWAGIVPRYMQIMTVGFKPFEKIYCGVKVHFLIHHLLLFTPMLSKDILFLRKLEIYYVTFLLLYLALHVICLHRCILQCRLCNFSIRYVWSHSALQIQISTFSYRHDAERSLASFFRLSIFLIFSLSSNREPGLLEWNNVGGQHSPLTVTALVV